MRNPIVTIEMENGGTFTIELYPEYAPQTVANFLKLAESNYYAGTTFHRVYPGFMAQGGEGADTPTIKGEFASNGFDNPLSHARGVISMARAQDPDSAGSQFFIMHADGDFLDGEYAAFGRVIEGIEAVDHVAEVETDAMDRPAQDQVIKSIRVETNGAEYPVEKIQ